MKKITIILFCLFAFQAAKANDVYYERAYTKLKSMLEGKEKLDFKKAIFTVENAWHKETLDYSEFDKKIKSIASKCLSMVKKKGIESYKTSGNWAIFMWMTQKIPENGQKACTYDFEDFLGDNDWSNTFVTRVLDDKKGTCLSLPLLYKCIAQDLKVEAKLTLGPSHTWIRHKDEEGKWANVELTSGQLPSDGLMMTELGITTEAVKSGAYFKPLTEKETIAFLLTQLAQGYENKHDTLDTFTEKCADLSIKYYKPNVVAYMIKSNFQAMKALNILEENGYKETEELKGIHKEYTVLMEKLIELGAGKIEKDDYQNWVNSMKKRKQ